MLMPKQNDKLKAMPLNVAALVLLAVVLAACSQSEDVRVGKPQSNPDGSQSEWVPVSSKRGRFSLLMPGVPKQETNVIHSAGGDVTSYTLTTVVSGRMVFAVEYHEVTGPAQGAGPMKPNWPLAIQRMQSKLLGSGGRLVGENEILKNGVEATDLVVESQSHVVVRIYHRLPMTFVATVVMPAKLFDSPTNPSVPLAASNTIAQFLDSIELQK